MKSIFGLLCVFALCGICNAKSAGVLAFISNHGVDDVVKSTANYYSEQLLHNVYHFNDVNGSFVLFIWDWNWKLSNIEFNKVSKPYAKAWTEDGLAHIIVEDLSMELTGDLEASSKNRLFVEHGKLQARVSFQVRARLYVGPNNTVIVKQCSSGFQSKPVVNLTLKSNLLDFLNRFISQLMEEHLNPQMLCDSMTQFRTNYKIYTLIRDPGFAIDLSIHHIMNVTEDGLTLALQGEMFDFTKSPLGDKNPIYAPPLPYLKFNKNKMTSFALGAYMLNTFFLAAIRKGMFNKTVNPQFLPDDQKTFFATKCIGVCLGNDIPEIGRLFNKTRTFVLFHMKVTEDIINTSISEKGLTFENSAELTFFIGNTTLFTLRTESQVGATLSMKPLTAVVEFKLIQLRLRNTKLVSSNVGHISDDVLELITNNAAKVQTMPMISDTFDRGIDMGQFIWIKDKQKPQRQIVHFLDAEIKLVKDAIIASADFSLKINDIGWHPTPLENTTDSNMVVK